MLDFSRIGISISNVFRRVVPDPFVIAIVLTVLTAILAYFLGDFEFQTGESQSRLVALLDAWRVDSGLWRFLAFGMQMCLILVTGHALALTRPVRLIVDALAALPRSTGSAAAMVAVVACTMGLLNWGLGLVVGAFIAREVGRSLEARGVKAHYPLLCAAGYMGMLVWHGGLSGSAPLAMTTFEGAAKVLPAEYLDQVGSEGIPLTETVLSLQNLIITGGLLILLPITLWLLAPKRDEAMQTIREFDLAVDSSDDNKTHESEVVSEKEEARTTAHSLPDFLDRSFVFAWILAIGLFVAFARYGYVKGDAASAVDLTAKVLATFKGLATVGLNELNIVMIALGLLLHASPRAYMNAITDGARGCAGIIIQFPLYAGIMAMMNEAGLINTIAEFFNRIGSDSTIPLLSFASAGVVNLFVPSGGGQWGIQGPITLETGLQAGIAPGRMIMAVAYGDQLTNMLQPFWALPLLGITGVRARDIVGYTAIVMVLAAAWMTLGLLIL